MERGVLFLVLLLVAAPVLATSDESDSCSITVLVLDEVGPLPGATVRLYDRPVEKRILPPEVDRSVPPETLKTGSTLSPRRADRPADENRGVLTGVDGRVTIGDLQPNQTYWLVATFPGLEPAVAQTECGVSTKVLEVTLIWNHTVPVSPASD